jgi:predicted CopG family antitoxin
MSTKTITIMDDAYKMLAGARMDDESFSDAIRRILSQKRNIMRFAGAWAHIDENKANEMKRTIKLFGEKLDNELSERRKKYALS